MIGYLSQLTSGISKIGHYFTQLPVVTDEEKVNTIHEQALKSISFLEECFCAKQPAYSNLFRKALQSEFFFEKNKYENHLIWGYGPVD
ncbi:MAG: hypothetical protein JSS09_09010, partial [Verrucomicrobia bacterium]|nr:hypothetical protein [Verrucomicrobiota bacterium]